MKDTFSATRSKEPNSKPTVTMQDSRYLGRVGRGCYGNARRYF